MRTAVVSSGVSQRLDAARAFLRAGSAHAPVLVLGASRDAADELVRSLAGEVPATFGWQRFSAVTLAHTLAAPALAQLGLAPATPRGLEAMAARATQQCLSRQQLTYFDGVATLPGFARALAATLRELRGHAVTPEMLGALGPAGVDLGVLLAAYEQQLTACGLADEARVLALASQVYANAHPGLLGVRTVLLDVPITHAAMRGFVAGVLRLAPDALFTVAAGDEETLAALPEELTLQTLAEPAPDTALGRIRDGLFSPLAPEGAAEGTEVALFSAPGEGRECVELARRILKLASQGVPLDRMAVLVRDPALYAAHLETALERAHIPAFFVRGTQRPDPSGRAFLALLSCAAEGLSARRFAEYLSLAQVPEPTAQGGPPPSPPAEERWVPPEDEALGAQVTAAERAGVFRRGRRVDPRQLGLFDMAPQDPPPVDVPHPPVNPDAPVQEGSLRAPWRWEEFLVEASVIGGLDRWKRRLAGLAAEWRLRVESLRRSDGPDSAEAARLERDLGNLAHLTRFALPVMELLAALPAAAQWGEWLEVLRQLAPRVLRHPERVQAVLADLQPMAPLGPVGLMEVRDVLLDPLSTLQNEPPARRAGRVLVGTPDHARGRSFDVVFVPGLAERVFPRKPNEDPLLLDDARTQLHTLTGRTLRTQPVRARAERLLLRLCAGAAAQRLVVSYARIQMPESRPRVPSFYALDIWRALLGRIPEVDQLERHAHGASQARLAWPAPPDPDDAIDDVEHDLAVLGPLLSSDGGGNKGRARYLLKLNDHLGRALRARYGRAQEAWSHWEGLVGRERLTPAARGALDARRLTAKAYSPSNLQKFSVCPYQFFLSAVHRLTPQKDAVPLESLDPLTKGSMFHAVQALALRRMKAQGMLPVTPVNLFKATAVLDAALDEESTRLRDNLCPAIPRVWEEAVAAMRTDLRTWLGRMSLEPEWVPRHFELGLGITVRPDMDPDSYPSQARVGPGYQVHGVIDLLEQHAQTGTWRVTDHKTGVNRTRKGRVTHGGRYLQPTIYALAYAALSGNTVESSRLYFCTAAGGFTQHSVGTAELNSVMALDPLAVVEHAFETGWILAAPDEGACTWCDYLQVCGPGQEGNIRRKARGNLTDLLRLREMS